MIRMILIILSLVPACPCFLGVTEYEVPSASAVLPNMRRVYRLLKMRDLKPTLKDTEVHILWPDNGTWYLAEVLEVCTQHSSIQPYWQCIQATATGSWKYCSCCICLCSCRG